MAARIEWAEVDARIGPLTYYGTWEGIKCFSVFYSADVKGYTGPKYVLKCSLPGFRPDLPRQVSVEAAQAFAEKMLTRWVAKRRLLFKDSVEVTDAMVNAARESANNTCDHSLSDESILHMIIAALQAREPKAVKK